MEKHVASPESRQRTEALLTDLWSRRKPLIEGQLETLERAGAVPLAEEARREAQSVAHKLAGSLGMFGFPEGTEIARELEILLECPTTQTDAIARLVKQLRSVLFAKS